MDVESKTLTNYQRYFMTIIVPVQQELDNGDFIYGLASDLIYGPWTNPSLMEFSKIFSCKDFVWGVTGDISIINLEALRSQTFSEFQDKLKVGTADSIIVVMHQGNVYTFDCNEGKKTWSNATFTGEPLSWGCFSTPFNARFNRYIIQNAEPVYEWISIIHAMYGYTFPNERVNSAVMQRCVKFCENDLYSGEDNYDL